MELNLEKLKEIHGNILTLIGPSGHTFIIREQNGEDDDILSNAKWVEDGSSSNQFLSNIVIHTSFTENGKLNISDALELKLSDKYFILVASRIFSIGQILKFSYEWPDGIVQEYQEDLGLYIWDKYHTKDCPFPESGDPDYFKYRIPPHNGGISPNKEIKLESGKTIRYHYVTGQGERFLMKLPLEAQSVNAELKARKLELKAESGWIPVTNFKTFSTMDMMEIRKEVNDNDANLSLFTELEHPETGVIMSYPIMGSNDFFYPLET